MTREYCILGDIHANLEALTAVLEECEKLGVEKYFCIGDIVGYNANPSECLEKVRSLPLVGVVMAAKALRLLVRRDEDYYDR